MLIVKSVYLLVTVTLIVVAGFMPAVADSTDRSEMADSGPGADGIACADTFNVTRTRLHSDERIDLCALTQNKAVLLVNTASHCGFTPQFKSLEALHQKYAPSGLVVIGVPSDDFRQEADTEAEAAEVCYKNYGVTFTMLQPTHVKGPQADSIFKTVNKQSVEPAWNFNKYLISADGRILGHWGSTISPASPELDHAVSSALAGANPG